jgi:hypothetical protein
VADQGFSGKDELRAWLTERGVTGYAQWLLVRERFGYADFLIASADELIDGQYADRPQLRPILDAILAAVQELGPVTVQARKTYVALVSPKRTFAIVKASTRSRVDLGLRLGGEDPEGRLLDGTRLGSSSVNLRVPLSSIDEPDAEALGHLERAFGSNT